MRLILAYLTLLLLPHLCYCQQAIPVAGARAEALAGAPATLSDAYALFNNAAGLAQIPDTTIFFDKRLAFGLAPLQNLYAGVALPLPRFSVAAGLQRFGGDLYNQQQISVAIAKKLGLAALGVSIGHRQFHLEGLGNERLLVVSMGGIATLTPKLKIGTYLDNANQARLKRLGTGTLPVILRTSVQWQPEEYLRLIVGAEKDLSQNPIWQVAIEYAITQHVVLRTGMSSPNTRGYFGFGLLLQHFKIHYALTQHPQLGFSHHGTVAYYLHQLW